MYSRCEWRRPTPRQRTDYWHGQNHSTELELELYYNCNKKLKNTIWRKGQPADFSFRPAGVFDHRRTKFCGGNHISHGWRCQLSINRFCELLLCTAVSHRPTAVAVHFHHCHTLMIYVRTYLLYTCIDPHVHCYCSQKGRMCVQLGGRIQWQNHTAENQIKIKTLLF